MKIGNKILVASSLMLLAGAGFADDPILNFGQVQPLGEYPQLQKTRVCN